MSLIFLFYNHDSLIDIKEDIVIHLAEKSQDLKNHNNKLDYYQSNTELTKLFLMLF